MVDHNKSDSPPGGLLLIMKALEAIVCVRVYTCLACASCIVKPLSVVQALVVYRRSRCYLNR